ncbi:GNAT family N-acetyltransferase [Microbacterium sp.]|uniref:GNAT family N-acetyltransferase n=1 Tax=Microbacterium sp. TaxID=51671 RepID=UPI00281191D1|nr:GNAT family N-acetyltransferase [Microbacterium sp.]
MTVLIRALDPSDRAAWESLFRGYRDFYGYEPDPGVIGTVWNWLLDDGHELQGLLAVKDGTPVGLAHWRRFVRPSRGGAAIFLDDLFTTSEARGAGIGTALVARLQETAASEGLLEVRWITSETNTEAQRLYDRLAERLPFVTYVAPPAGQVTA